MVCTRKKNTPLQIDVQEYMFGKKVFLVFPNVLSLYKPTQFQMSVMSQSKFQYKFIENTTGERFVFTMAHYPTQLSSFTTRQQSQERIKKMF